MKKIYSYLVFVSVLAGIIFACSKKKDDPAPANNTSTTGATSTTGTTSVITTTNTAGFNDGISTTTVGYIDASKNSKTGHITLSLMKGEGEFPIVFLSISSPKSTGTYTDNSNSPNTFAQLKYPGENFTTDLQKGGTCTINVTKLSENIIGGNFTFKATNPESGTRNVTGTFDCNYTTK